MSGLQPIDITAAVQISRQGHLFGWQIIEHEGPEAELVSLSRRGSSEIIYELDVAIDVLAGRRVRFTPIMGLIHVETGRLVSSFSGRAAVGEGRPAATIGRSLADLIRAEGHEASRRWIANSAEDVDRAVESVFCDVVAFGLPFVQSFVSLESIIQWLEQASPYQEIKANLAVACMLDNRRSDAIRALAEYVGYAEAQSPLIADRSWRFVNAYIDHFGLDESMLPFRVIRTGRREG